MTPAGTKDAGAAGMRKERCVQLGIVSLAAVAAASPHLVGTRLRNIESVKNTPSHGLIVCMPDLSALQRRDGARAR
jgi:hypothetical protein